MYANGGTVTNCIIAGNMADFGGGVYAGRVFNSVICNNIATSRGGGVYGGTVTNCIIAGNMADFGGGGYSIVEW